MEALPPEPGLIFQASRQKKQSPLRLEPVSQEGKVVFALAPWHVLAGAISVLFGLPLPVDADTLDSWADRALPASESALEAAVKRHA
jgi:hypothetical protein